MKQMVNKTAPAKRKAFALDIQDDQFVRLPGGKIFFFQLRENEFSFFPVLEDGTIHPSNVGIPSAVMTVEIVSARDLGIKTANRRPVWADESLVRDY